MAAASKRQSCVSFVFFWNFRGLFLLEKNTGESLAAITPSIPDYKAIAHFETNFDL
jgi:hypothetical protein